MGSGGTAVERAGARYVRSKFAREALSIQFHFGTIATADEKDSKARIAIVLFQFLGAAKIILALLN